MEASNPFLNEHRKDQWDAHPVEKLPREYLWLMDQSAPQRWNGVP